MVVQVRINSSRELKEINEKLSVNNDQSVISYDRDGILIPIFCWKREASNTEDISPKGSGSMGLQRLKGWEIYVVIRMASNTPTNSV